MRVEKRKLILLVILIADGKERHGRIHFQAMGLKTLPSESEGFRIFSCQNDTSFEFAFFIILFYHYILYVLHYIDNFHHCILYMF